MTFSKAGATLLVPDAEAEAAAAETKLRLRREAGEDGTERLRVSPAKAAVCWLSSLLAADVGVE